MNPVNILFITRARNYPPKVGGLEIYSYNLIKEFEAYEITFKITLSRTIKHLIGIVTLEAGSCGLRVVANNIQGLRDAVIDGETGYLVEKGDVEGFAGRVTDMNLKKEQIRNTENSTFDWAKIYKDYRIFLFPLQILYP